MSKESEQFSDTMDILLAIQQYRVKYPDADIESIFSPYEEMLPVLELLRTSELSKFVNYAKEQGTKMTFSEMELGVVAAGRKDMQKGLEEIADSLKFENPKCPECGEKEDNRGRSKKN
jgi:hypothetical protein